LTRDRGDSIENFEDRGKALSEGSNVGALLDEAHIRKR
jgi:hypothetical protein